MCGRLPDLTNAIKDYAAQFDANALTAERAAEVVSHCSAIEGSVAAIKALAADRLAQSNTWKSEGYRSAADQLSAASGISTAAARSTIETGRRLDQQPDVARAALSGELSPSETALVANGVDAAPDKSAELLEKAFTSSVSELTDEVARIKAARADQEARHEAIRAKRRLRSWTDLEGFWRLACQGLPEDGARMRTVIAAVRRALILARRERGITNEPFEALDYDSVMTLMKIALGTNTELSLADLHRNGLFPCLDDIADLDRNGLFPCLDDIADLDRNGLFPCLDDIAPQGPVDIDQPDTSRGDTPDSSKKRKRNSPRRRRRGTVTTQIQVRVDLDALLRGVPLEGELCEIVGYGPIPVSVVEDLLANDNAFVVGALTKAKQTVGIYHSGRHPTAYQRSALSFFYPTCAVQGCNTKAFLQFDHREDWAKTHFTVYDLMDRLCTFHHGLKTNQGWALVCGSGKREFVPPDDPRHPRNRGSTVEPPDDPSEPRNRSSTVEPPHDPRHPRNRGPTVEPSEAE